VLEIDLKLDLSFDLAIAGFSHPEIDQLMAAAQTGTADEAKAEDALPEPDSSPPVSRSGDVWQLGEHRILCGDATDPQVCKALLGEERASVGIYDPSYRFRRKPASNLVWPITSGKLRRCMMFKGRHFDRSVILLCVRWYLAYSLSLWVLEEMIAERGISVDHATIHRWTTHYAPILLERFNSHERAVTGQWHVHETCIEVRGCWMYLYRAIDSNGYTVEFWFSVTHIPE
jgi:hypothetical protein